MFEGQSQAEIETLMKANTEFRQLFYRHRELDRQVMDAELPSFSNVAALHSTTFPYKLSFVIAIGCHSPEMACIGIKNTSSKLLLIFCMIITFFLLIVWLG